MFLTSYYTKKYFRELVEAQTLTLPVGKFIAQHFSSLLELLVCMFQFGHSNFIGLLLEAKQSVA